MLRSFMLSIGLLAAFNLSAQLELEGLWEGSITIYENGSFQRFPMQLYINKNGKQLTGRTYVFKGEQRLEFEWEGRMYDDLSIYVDELSYVSQEGDEYIPPYLRKYQLIWNRGIAGSSLNGYWQEQRKDIFNKRRRRGRIYLQKVINTKA